MVLERSPRWCLYTEFPLWKRKVSWLVGFHHRYYTGYIPYNMYGSINALDVARDLINLCFIMCF